MKKLSRTVEDVIINMTKDGSSSRKIAKELNISQSAVIRVLKRRNVAPQGRVGGRRKLLTDGDARLMMRKMRADTFLTPKEASLLINKNVSRWTARRALHNIGYISAVKKPKPALSNKNVAARLKFARQHKDWTVEDWKRVIWSDESKFNRYQSDGKQYYWRRQRETIQRHHVKQTVKHGGGNIMVWGCFTWWHVGPLQKIDGIMRKEDYLNILKTHLPDFVDMSEYPEEEVVFQQDGDPKHTSKIVKEWLTGQNFQLMEWPPQSPDLNPIENLWSIVKRRLGQYRTAPSNLSELWQRVQLEWQKIPDEIIQKLVESMPNRINMVLQNKGLWTKY